MRIVVSNSADKPLYAQIAEQVKVAILGGEVHEGDPLPSIRVLARDLRISIITVSRAYSELEAEGFVTTVQGKGAFVAPIDSAMVREQLLRRVELGLGQALDAADLAQVDRDGVVEMLDVLVAARTEQEVQR